MVRTVLRSAKAGLATAALLAGFSIVGSGPAEAAPYSTTWQWYQDVSSVWTKTASGTLTVTDITPTGVPVTALTIDSANPAGFIGNPAWSSDWSKLVFELPNSNDIAKFKVNGVNFLSVASAQNLDKLSTNINAPTGTYLPTGSTKPGLFFMAPDAVSSGVWDVIAIKTSSTSAGSINQLGWTDVATLLGTCQGAPNGSLTSCTKSTSPAPTVLGTFFITSIPEPVSAVLFAGSLVGLGLVRRRQA